MKAKEPIKIRFKKLANGNQSVFLARWNGNRYEYEFLRLYLVPTTAPNAKEHNAQVMRAAEKIKADRISALLAEGAGLKASKRKSILLTDYINTYIRQNKNGKSENWELHIQVILNTLVAYKGNNIYMSDLDKDFCKGYNEFLLTKFKKANGMPLKQKSARNYSTTFKAILNGAVRDGVIEKNPFYELAHSEKIRDTETQRAYLTIDEVKSLINTEYSNDLIKRAFLFACFCGLRFSDVEQLRWCDICTNGKITQVEKQQKKTKKSVYIPLSEQAISFLPKQVGEADGLVFDGLPSLVAVEANLKKWTETAGITKHVTFHIARHTFATLSLQGGADIYTVSKLLGHSSIINTQIYAKIIDEHKRDAVDRLGKLFV